MKVTDVSYTSIGIQVVCKTILNKPTSRYDCYVYPYWTKVDVNPERARVIAGRFLPPVVGVYKLVKVDCMRFNNKVLYQFSWKPDNESLRTVAD